MRTGPSFVDQSSDPRRLVAITVIVAVHAVAIYGLSSWGIRSQVKPKPAPVQVALINEETPTNTEIKPPPHKLFTPEVQIEVPVIELPQMAESPPTITVAYKQEVSPKPIATAPTPKLISTVEYLKPLRPHYPPISRRLKEEGMVVLLVLVDERGKASRVEVRDSSGFKRLDLAAREAAECALFKPYVEDGIARPALVLIPVEFSLNQRVAQR